MRDVKSMSNSQENIFIVCKQPVGGGGLQIGFSNGSQQEVVMSRDTYFSGLRTCKYLSKYLHR